MKSQRLSWWEEEEEEEEVYNLIDFRVDGWLLDL